MAIVERGSVEIGEVLPAIISPLYNPIDVAEVDGRVLSTKAPALSLVAVPPYALARRLAPPFPVAVWATTLATVGLAGALLGVLVHAAARDLGAGEGRAIALALATGLGTNLFHWSTVMFSHALTTAALFGAWWCWARREDAAAAALAGLWGGVAVASDYYAAVPLAVLGAGVLAASASRRDPRPLAAFVLGGLGPALALGAYHQVALGTPFDLPYRHGIHFGAQHRSGLFGIGWPSPREGVAILLGPRYGLFPFNPLLLVAVAALPAWVRRHGRGAALPLAMVASLWLVVAGTGRGPFGDSWGPRHLVPAIPFLMLSLATAGPRLSDAAWVLGTVSVLLNWAMANASLPPPAGRVSPWTWLLDTFRTDGGRCGAALLAGLEDPALRVLVGLVPFAVAGLAWAAWALARARPAPAAARPGASPGGP